ncbi:MAG: recombinase RecT [Dehalococcoidia bacterium]|jgi:hypothetical protein
MAKRGRPKGAVKKPKKLAAVAKERGLVKAAQIAPVVTKEELTEAAIIKAFDLLGIGAKLDAQQKALFVEMAKLYHLNPLKREIHAVQMGGKLVPVTGYEVYIQRARDTGLLQYWHVDEDGEGQNYKAILVIKRRDWPQEFRWTARYSEVKRSGPMWQERPTFMTQKVAISQGFRLCFGEELGGMPYTVEEMTDGRPPDPERNEPRRLNKVPLQVGAEYTLPMPSKTKEAPVGAQPERPVRDVFDLGGEARPSAEAGARTGDPVPGGDGSGTGSDGIADAVGLFAAIIKKLNASSLDPQVKIDKMKAARDNRENPEKLKEILNGF